MATKLWDGSSSALWDDGDNWPGGTIPADGDDVIFDGHDVVTNDCTTGPSVVVGLNSITARDSYDNSCCFDNCVVNTVSIEDNSVIIGGIIDTATLAGTGATCTINGSSVVITTANLTGTDVRAQAAQLISTLNLSGDGAYAHNGVAAANLVITTAYLTGGTSGGANYARLGRCQVGTAYMQGDDTRILSACEGIGAARITVNVSGDNVQLSATQIAAGEMDVYMMAYDVVLEDDDTGEVLVDTTTADHFGPGEF